MGAMSEGARAGALVLLVDDERLIRFSLRHYLQKHGFTVLVAEDGAHALQLASASAAPIDVLVTDVSLPGIDGFALARRLARPGLAVVYTSGHQPAQLVESGRLAPDEVALCKPFTEAALIDAIARARGRSESPA